VVIVQRIIRSKDSKVARLVGGVKSVNTVAEAIALAKRSRKVYVFIDADNNEGTIRSGRKMRTCDSHVRNTLPAGFPVQRSLF
jgi:5S rRNA maturation endonuclease (ribonuclease M5)